MKRTLVSVTACGALLCGAMTASAQTLAPGSSPGREYRGVYAGGTGDSAQVLGANGSISAGYDTSAERASAEAGLPINPNLPYEGSMYNQLSGGLSYSANLKNFSAGASLSTSARQYPQTQTPITLGHGASGGVLLKLGTRTTVNGNTSMTFSSMRTFMPFPELDDPEIGQIATPPADFASSQTRYYNYMTSASINRQLSPRSSVTAAYDRQQTAYSNGIEGLDRQGASFRFTRNLSRDLSLRLGYGYTEARYPFTNDRYRSHNLDTGVDYHRALSLTRRTSLAFSTGATAVNQDQITRFDVIGNVTARREIGRTWGASLAYNRNVRFDDAFLQPVFSDGISGGFGGLINRRLSFQSGVGASRGTIGMSHTSSDNVFDAMNAFAGLNSAINRYLSLGVNYTYYRYNFEQDPYVLSGLRPHLNRHSVNVTLSTWAPLFQRGKRSNASR